MADMQQNGLAWCCRMMLSGWWLEFILPPLLWSICLSVQYFVVGCGLSHRCFNRSTAATWEGIWLDDFFFFFVTVGDFEANDTLGVAQVCTYVPFIRVFLLCVWLEWGGMNMPKMTVRGMSPVYVGGGQMFRNLHSVLGKRYIDDKTFS